MNVILLGSSLSDVIANVGQEFKDDGQYIQLPMKIVDSEFTGNSARLIIRAMVTENIAGKDNMIFEPDAVLLS